MKEPSKPIARRPKPRGKPQPPATPREAAFEAIRRHAERFPDILPADPRCDRLDERDAALARALYDATVRRWRTLAFVLNTRLRRPMHTLEPGLQAALLVGAAQLLLMDRVPDHAAINESVEWTKRRVRPGAAKMVNAVLRALSRLRGSRDDALSSHDALARRDAIPLSSGAVLVLTEAIFPEDDLERLAILCGLPTWLVTRWSESFDDRGRDQCLHTLTQAPITLNIAHATAPLGEIDSWPDHAEPAFKLVPAGQSLGGILSSRDDIWVQDPSSASPVAALPDLSPRLIIDVCAGQGTKTRQLLARFPNARIIASDTDERRMTLLKALADRHPNLETCPAAELPYQHAGAADLALLDVPCTNTGVLARRLEARHRCAQRQLDRLADAQRQIIADTIRLLAPGASLLYATCSLEPEECDAQAAWTTRWHNLRLAASGKRDPAGQPGADPATYADGARWALLGGPAASRRSR